MIGIILTVSIILSLGAVIIYYTSVVNDKNDIIETIVNQNDQLQADLEGNMTDYTYYQSRITELENQIALSNITDYKLRIADLEDQIEGFNITYYQSRITELENQIASLNNQIEDLQQQIDAIRDLPIYADGTTLRDGFGNEIYLKSVNVNDKSRHNIYGTRTDGTSTEESWFTEVDILEIKSYGGNCFEVHNECWSRWMPRRDDMDEEFFETWIDKYAEWAEKHQVYLILNIFRFTQSSSMDNGPYQMPWWFFGSSRPDDKSVTDQWIIDFWDTDNPRCEENRESFIYMWTWVANRYKDNPYVIYSIVNEPLCTNSLMDGYWSEQIGRTYAIMIERVIDGIRSTGAKQLIFVDEPYVWYLSDIQPVQRVNVVWEVHLYVSESYDMNRWKNVLDDKLQKFLYDFDKPVFIGEYGTDRPVVPVGWQQSLSEEVGYLETKDICGRQWHAWGYLEDEFMDYVYDYFNAEESDWILNLVLG